MAFSFREYHPKKEKSKSRGIPLIRTLLFIAGVFFVYRFTVNKGLIENVRQYFISAPLKSVEEKLSWEECCKQSSGVPFRLRERVMQCSWVVHSFDFSSEFPSILRYSLSIKDSLLPLKVHWVGEEAHFESAWFFGLEKENDREWFLRVPQKDSSFVWVSESTGCFYPGFCPRNPLKGGVLAISEDFDFEGREDLMMKDLFMGIGETPVFPVLPGRILSVREDSLGYTVEMDHGDNLMSRYSGLFSIDSLMHPGNFLTKDSVIARLAPKDSAYFYLEILRNGKFVRWKDFFAQSYPLPDTVISKFRETIRF